MRIPALLVVLLAWCGPLAAQDKDKKGQDLKVPKEPVKDWKFRRTDQRFDPKTKTEIEELTMSLQGKEAIPVDPKKLIFDLKGVMANYYTSPDKDKFSKEIVLQADEGRYDHEARTLKLKDNIRVVKKNEEPGKPPQADTVLKASSGVLRFNQ